MARTSMTSPSSDVWMQAVQKAQRVRAWLHKNATPLDTAAVAEFSAAFSAYAAASGLAERLAETRADMVTLETAAAAQAWAWREHTLLPGLAAEAPLWRPRIPVPPWVIAALHLEQRGAPAERPASAPQQARRVPFIPPAGTIVSEAMAQLAVEALHAAADQRLERWTQPPDAAPYYADNHGRTVIVNETEQHTGLSQAQGERFWNTVMNLDDDTVAVFLICLAKWFSAQDDGASLADHRVHVTDILAFQGAAKHKHGGYHKERKQKVAQEILTLNSIWVAGPQTVYEEDRRGRRREKVVMVNSRLIEVAIESQLDLWEEGTPYAFRIRPGAWAQPYIGSQNRMTAQLLRPVMQYDPRQGVSRMAMRLGIYLTFQWRIRASHGTYDQPWRVRTLLEGAHLPIPTDRRIFQRFRDQVQLALDALHKDGVIGGWAYARGNDDQLPRYGWFPHWLTWTITIDLPTVLATHYSAIPGASRHPNAPRASASTLDAHSTS